MGYFRVPCPSQPTVPLNLQGPGLNLGRVCKCGGGGAKEDGQECGWLCRAAIC